MNMKITDKKQITDEEKLFSGIVWLNSGILGLALGLLCGLTLFIATNWLLIKGGENAGAHMRLLSQFFIGYNISFWGSFVGFAYGFAMGTLSGALVGWIYNKFVAFRN